MKRGLAISLVMLGWSLVLVGCGGSEDRLTQLLNGQKQPVVADLEDPSPLVRVHAIRWAGDHKIHQAVPLLVDRLQEEDPMIRFYAIEALKKITGTDLGYDYKADEIQRRQAVERWRASCGQIRQERGKPEAGS